MALHCPHNRHHIIQQFNRCKYLSSPSRVLVINQTISGPVTTIVCGWVDNAFAELITSGEEGGSVAKQNHHLTSLFPTIESSNSFRVRMAGSAIFNAPASAATCEPTGNRLFMVKIFILYKVLFILAQPADKVFSREQVVLHL